MACILFVSARRVYKHQMDVEVNADARCGQGNRMQPWYTMWLKDTRKYY
jgi:hypothetical protein